MNEDAALLDLVISRRVRIKVPLFELKVHQEQDMKPGVCGLEQLIGRRVSVMRTDSVYILRLEDTGDLTE